MLVASQAVLILVMLLRCRVVSVVICLGVTSLTETIIETIDFGCYYKACQRFEGYWPAINGGPDAVQIRSAVRVMTTSTILRTSGYCSSPVCSGVFSKRI